jgi:hypothetical protein
VFSGNVIAYNSSLQKGGGAYLDGFSPTFNNNTFSQNYIYGGYGSYGGGIFLDFGTPNGKNNISYGNHAQSGPNVFAAGGLISFTYSCTDSLLPGTGNIAANPLFVDPANNFALSWTHFPIADSTKSPCIDTGDPASPLDPDNTRADMGAIYFNQAAPPTPSLDITVTPLNPPITIPASGGSFQFTVAIRRVTAPQAPFAVWARIKYPNGTYTAPVLGPVTINLPVNVTVTRQRTQTIPSTYPAGLFTYLGYANNTFAYPAIDSSSFNFTKLATGNGPYVWEATCTGELFPGEIAALSPATSALIGAAPNPFNPVTTIRFELRAASHASLKVFDTAGRLVTSLVEGWQEAGSHQVRFDGSNLSSGVYLYTLMAGSEVTTGKMVLMK